MMRCIQLAKNGLGTTYPNPLVGCIIVHNDKIIGEGWHRKAGKAHAEVHAIQSVKNKALLLKSTLYVNLEPCNHTGQTPPCSDLIVAMKIPIVVIGSMDPNPKVAGTGIQKLKAAGCEVIENILQEDCNHLNKRFFTFHKLNRPYILLKWAQSIDGYIAPEQTNGGPFWISNEYSVQIVHKMRTQEQAILVGRNTAAVDNPKLTARNWFGANPMRMVTDRNTSLPADNALFDGSVPTLVFSEKKGENKKNLSYESIDFSKEISTQIVEKLFTLNIQSLIVEGGAKILQTFINSNLWDEAYVFEGNMTIHRGVKAPSLTEGVLIHGKDNGDQLFHFKNSSTCYL